MSKALKKVVRWLWPECVANTEALYETPDEARPNVEETDAEIEARAFVGENRPYIQDGGKNTLTRVRVQGSKHYTTLSDEVIEAADALTDAKNDLAAAIRNPEAPASRIAEIEEREQHLSRVYESRQRAFEWFQAFTDDVQRRLDALRDE